MPGVKVEFLRHGPPHNQLLSPLTPYLAVCGDHAAVTVRVPFEHEVLARRLHTLAAGAKGGDESLRQGTLAELGKEMACILGQIPGLIADLPPSQMQEGGVAHLRLVLSANELALLPFELAMSCDGLPGAGQPLVLQNVLPICMTREIRRPRGVQGRWPSACRILLAAASPPGVPPVPLEAHLLALRQAIAPWVRHYDEGTPGGMPAAVGEHLTVLPRATPRALTEAMASGRFTHVHLLAHGAGYRQGDDKRYGIALHHDHDPGGMDVLDGERLANVLRAHQERPDRTLALPAVVTLATCDSANVGGVISSGASLAHDLHRAGVALVVASQFPLSYPGSVHLAQILYRGLLAGRDPCLVLDDLRRRLRALVPQHHDWAGLVVYAGLPSDLAQQLPGVRLTRARLALEAAMSHLDALAHDLSERYAHHRVRGLGQIAEDIAPARQRFHDAHRELDELRADAPDLSDEICGLLASAEKRLADVLWRTERRIEELTGEDLEVDDLDLDWRHHLLHAEQHYRTVFEIDRSASWALVQAMSLHVLHGDVPVDDWNLARLISLDDLDHAEEPRRVWALNNLVELAVLALVPVKPLLSEDAARALAGDAVARLRVLGVRHRMALHSLRRQLLRYGEGFLTRSDSAAGCLAAELFEQVRDDH